MMTIMWDLKALYQFIKNISRHRIKHWLNFWDFQQNMTIKKSLSKKHWICWSSELCLPCKPRPSISRKWMMKRRTEDSSEIENACPQLLSPYKNHVAADQNPDINSQKWMQIIRNEDYQKLKMPICNFWSLRLITRRYLSKHNNIFVRNESRREGFKIYQLRKMHGYSCQQDLYVMNLSQPNLI